MRDKLTAAQVRGARAPEGKTRKLSDGRGLQLWVTANSKTWRMMYRFAGKQRSLTLGEVEHISLAQARELVSDAHKQLAEGRDPKEPVKPVSVDTLGTLIDDFIQRRYLVTGRSEATVNRVRWQLGLLADLFNRPIAAITVEELDKTFQSLQSRKIAELPRARSALSSVFRLAIQTGRATSNPAEALRGAVTAPPAGRRAGIIAPAEVGRLLLAIDDYGSRASMHIGLKLLMLTFVRPGELRFARWQEFDLERAVWEIPAERMKMRRPHRVPLARQTLAALEELPSRHRADQYLLPAVTYADRPISENTLNASLRRLGYAKEEVCAHGFRVTASTLLNESGLWSSDAIERQLAHQDSNAVRRAYARGDRWAERVEMMQWWADHLDHLQAQALRR